LLAVVVALGASVSSTQHWSWQRGLPFWIIAIVVVVLMAIGFAAPPRLRLTNRRLQLSPVMRTVSPRMSGSPIPDNVLAVEIQTRSRHGLANCAARLTRIEHDTPVTWGPQGPVRLYWTPSHSEVATIPHGASDAVEVARLEAGTVPVLDSPDFTSLPWGLATGDWSIVLQLTADGFAATHFTGAFSVGDDSMTWRNLARVAHPSHLRFFHRLAVWVHLQDRL